ncbi:imm11 family protein [Pseudomonas sp.]|uniref:imm11 family protein n=1 Tax=Pseudomonas sp. TaxID=306 RepID=UPI003C719EB3
MKYYSMCHEVVDGGYTDGDVLFFPELDDYYQVGKSLSLAKLKVEVSLDKKVRRLKSDFFLTTCGAFFVSKELKDVLEEVNAKVQFASASVEYFDGRSSEKQYFFIHANEMPRCFDYDLSEYSGKTMVLSKIQADELDADYRVRGIKKMHINEAKAGGLDFFFVGGVIWIDPIASEELVQKVESKKLLVRFDAVGESQ